jgi:2-oxo-4-hydroxy-4-carboxy-5-ureidoimidazoline decarboxylase
MHAVGVFLLSGRRMNLPTGPGVRSLTGQPSISLAALNALPKREFMRLLGDVVEHSAWVAERAFTRRPFASLDDLNAQLMACIRESGNSDMVALFNRHPELAGREAVAGEMTESSTGEQGRLGLIRLPPRQYHRLSRINYAHRENFGFPFIAALRLHRDLESVMREGEASLNNSLETEIGRTLRQISAIVYGRLTKIVS